ncbi:MAG: hypothetical protein NTW87_17630 [Planctomycetota bacterium]|nr:hypothetical protein [Planctomycetota bacterium]
MRTRTSILAAVLLGCAIFWFLDGGASGPRPRAAAASRPPALTQTVPAPRPSAIRRGCLPAYRFSGPYTHANLTLYLAHGADAVQGTFLTLQEALEQKKVVVHETGNVSELVIENLSTTEEVFVQSGDIVKGGRQDRVIATDFILPRQSGKMPIASFCVEHGRWSQRGGEAPGHFSSSTEQAPGKELKLAAKQHARQAAVWEEVAKTQGKLARNLSTEVKAPESASSFELTLENRAVRETAEDYVKALSGVLDGKNDAIGFVFAINGTVNNADIYAAHDLFVKLWPKLLKAAAVEAIAERQRGQQCKPVPVEEVRKLVEEPEQATPREKAVTPRVKVLTKETNDHILFETSDGERGGSSVHKSYLKK